jgi:hypothetical protein
MNINKDNQQLLKMQIIAAYNQCTQESRERQKTREVHAEEIDKKIHRRRERYVNEEIDTSMYEEFNPNNQLMFDTNGLASGVYFVKVKSAEQNVTMKLVKE